MPAKAKLPSAFIEKAREEAERRTIRLLSNIGDECVSEAVNGGNYTDQTGNLRSSIGYVVAKDGAVVAEGGFWNVGGEDGQNTGRRVAFERAAETTGLALILVAGMDYAQYVADRGFNVLDSAELLAKRLVSQLRS